MIEGRFVFDTNALLNNPNYVTEVSQPLVPYVVLQELDKLKMERESERGWQARQAVRTLKQNVNRIGFVDYYSVATTGLNNDDLIIQTAIDNGADGIVTGDILMRLKCLSVGLKVIEANDNKDEEEYKGYVEKKLNDDELANFYENLDSNIFGLLTNQYLIIRDGTNQVVQSLRWNGECYDGIDKFKKGFKTNQFGKMEPRDVYQQLTIDSLFNNQVTMVKGKAGSGKSLLSLSYAYHMIEKGKYDKLIAFVNPLASIGSARLGFYPGTRDEKLLDSAVGSMLGAKFGDKSEVQYRIDRGELILLPFSDIRGFDTSGQNAIVYIIESQNLNIDLMKLAIQRVGEDSKLIIDGDYNTQVDSPMYSGSNNGMRRASQIFRGEDYYGEVELPIIYRSKMAARADLM